VVYTRAENCGRPLRRYRACSNSSTEILAETPRRPEATAEGEPHACNRPLHESAKSEFPQHPGPPRALALAAEHTVRAPFHPGSIGRAQPVEPTHSVSARERNRCDEGAGQGSEPADAGDGSPMRSPLVVSPRRLSQWRDATSVASSVPLACHVRVELRAIAPATKARRILREAGEGGGVFENSRCTNCPRPVSSVLLIAAWT